MNRIEKTFQELRKKKEKALVGFITAGDPTIDDSHKIIEALCTSGIDILELGIPFSDPTADGPVIQRSSARALSKGCCLKTVIGMTKTIRSYSEIPIILFSYYNPVLAYGNDSFYRDSTAAGADGVLIVDLPPEESDEMTSCWQGKDFSLIRLIAPTTPASRMRQIALSASGFIYLVSKTGVTGSDGIDMNEISRHVESLRSITELPVCVGFGISTSDDVKAIAGIADGVVIGSAFERLIEENLSNPDLAGIAAEKTHEYKKATKQQEFKK